MKNILVPTDFSHCAFEALQVAANLAKKSGATLHLAHFYEKPLAGISLEIQVDLEALRSLKEEIKEEMGRLVTFDFMDGLEVVTHFIPEMKLWEAFHTNTIIDIDFVVMGSHGASGFKEFFLGSNAQKMIQMSPVPVLTVKDFADMESIRDVVFASNFYEENEGNFESIRDFVSAMDARVHLLHVVTPTNFVATDYSEKLMEDFAAAVGLGNYTINIYNAMSVEAGILAFTEKSGAGMIAMETHGRTGFAHFFNGSVAEQVANHMAVPFLSMRIKESEPARGVVFPDMR